MGQRVTYRRRCSYATKGNKFSVVKTPGGKLAMQYITKKARGPKCGDCGGKIIGVPGLRWLALWILRASANHPCLLGGGAEDRQGRDPGLYEGRQEVNGPRVRDVCSLGLRRKNGRRKIR